ncbi:MAG: hypothetical protein OS112_03285 [Methanoregula sp.]|nr:MAG: hypothetical protein OS112_03285 [Methanoregula sp.]
MAIEQWQIDSRKAAGWSDTEIQAWLSSAQNGGVQVGSQFWMDTNYTGPEPTLDVKRAFSDAQYAYDYAQAQMAAIQQQITAGVAAPKTDFTPNVLVNGKLVPLTDVVKFTGTGDYPADPIVKVTDKTAIVDTNTAIVDTNTTVQDLITKAGGYGMYLLAGVAVLFIVLVFVALPRGSRRGVRA